MRRITPFILLLLTLLCGCVREDPQATAQPDQTQTVQETTAPGYYHPGSALEQSSGGAVRSYPLMIQDAAGIRTWGQGLLLFSGEEETTLTLLTGEDLHPAAQRTLGCLLSPQDPSLQLWEDGLSYYDPVSRQTVVLDEGLREVSHIAAPEDLTGTPILSRDRSTLYYCTAASLRAWSLETGIRRQIKEIALPEQCLTGLYEDGGLLRLQGEENGQVHTLLVSSETGQTLQDFRGTLDLSIQDGRYYASFQTGMTWAMVFGQTASQSAEALTPQDLSASCVFLPGSEAAVTLSQPDGGGTLLEYYQLQTGRRCSSLYLSWEGSPLGITGIEEDAVYLLAWDPEFGCMSIFRWEISQDNALAVQDSRSYTGPFYTRENPDYAGLAQCQAQAAQISQTYGVQVLIWEDAMAIQPWDYDFEEEYLVPVLQQELTALEKRLANFPEGMLEQTASHFSGLTICLVRELTGSAESGSLETATGIQFFEQSQTVPDPEDPLQEETPSPKNHAYVVLAVGPSSEKALYHELFHVMETHIYAESIAFDQWDSLNPAGFSYDYDYIANESRQAGVYLEGENRAFIDTYSMSYPKEDRARIMEYAMTSGNDSLFQSQTMQSKLLAVCQGIREAYGLKKSPETYLWEQYLEDSLAYTG